MIFFRLIPLRICAVSSGATKLDSLGLRDWSGGIAGLSVAALLGSTNLLHLWLFGHPHLSNLTALDSPFQALIPLAGRSPSRDFRDLCAQMDAPKRPVDPIEANALQGGRMSLKDSVVIAAQTVVSNGFGASVGLEAAYTQMGSGLASWLGTAFRLRRGDMRTLVACGSAGAIGAAFGAPLTGAFYAFELILGTYTPFGLAPVGAAAVCGVLVSKAFGASGEFMNQMTLKSALSHTDMGLLLLLGDHLRAVRDPHDAGRDIGRTICARIALPRALQPAFGGLLVGLLALVTPHVLASGHGALFELFGPGPGPSDVILITLLLEGARVGGFARHRLSRRSFLCLALSRRHDRLGLFLRGPIFRSVAGARHDSSARSSEWRRSPWRSSAAPWR